jgi:UDP-N-acetylglucosamine 2-epimerase
MSHPMPTASRPNTQSPPICVFIGTKAQYIKTAPLLRLMQAQGIPYRLIDTGQHAAFVPKLRRELGIKEPDATLASPGNIKTVSQVVLWFLRHLLVTLFRPQRLRRDIFGEASRICIIHGDTPSTLLALIMAKRAGLKVAHLEAGLRSFKLFKPFPEEIIRIICMRFSEYLFAPSDVAERNMQRMRIKGRAVHIGQNTNVEALYYALGQSGRVQSPASTPAKHRYALITIHRVETILNRRRLEQVIALIERIAHNWPAVFVMHDPTRVQLEQHGHLERLAKIQRLRIVELLGHASFLALIEQASFVITDGGSIQEECHYLDVPCLVMRSETERYEGIGDNVVLSHFDGGIIDAFLRSYSSLRRGARTPNQEPSKVILAALLESLEGLAAGTAPDRIEGVPGESEWAPKAATESSGG